MLAFLRILLGGVVFFFCPIPAITLAAPEATSCLVAGGAPLSIVNLSLSNSISSLVTPVSNPNTGEFVHNNIGFYCVDELCREMHSGSYTKIVNTFDNVKGTLQAIVLVPYFSWSYNFPRWVLFMTVNLNH